MSPEVAEPLAPEQKEVHDVRRRNEEHEQHGETEKPELFAHGRDNRLAQRDHLGTRLTLTDVFR